MVIINKILNSAKSRLLKLFKPVYFKVFSYNVECNICKWRDFKLSSDKWHPYTICPNCQSQVRQRLFWATVNNHTELSIEKVFRNKKILHFAPDQCLTKKISMYTREYWTADLLVEGYKYNHIDLNIDMSDMGDIKSEDVDCVIAFDVLEHVFDHLKAIEETNRVLSLGGNCIFTVPQMDNLQTTREDLSDLKPVEREKKFGQSDHWRIYGNDFKDMLEERGFEVRVIDARSFDNKLVSKHILYPSILSKHQLATNDRKIYFGKKVRSIKKDVLN